MDKGSGRIIPGRTPTRRFAADAMPADRGSP
jgi:hypothetical protein